MWNWLWVLPAVLLIWAIVLVIRKIRHAGKRTDSKERAQSVEERLAAIDDEGDRGRA